MDTSFAGAILPLNIGKRKSFLNFFFFSIIGFLLIPHFALTPDIILESEILNTNSNTQYMY